MSRSLKTSPQEFNKYLLDLCMVQKEKLPLDVCINIINLTKNYSVQLPQDHPEKRNLLLNFNSVLLHFPESDEFMRYMNDSDFLQSIFAFAIANTYDNSPFLILEQYMRGTMFKTKISQDPRCNDSYRLYVSLLYKDIKIIECLTLRFKNFDAKYSASTLSFIPALYDVLKVKCNTEVALKVILNVWIYDTPGYFGQQIHGENCVLPLEKYGATFKAMSVEFCQIFTNLLQTKFDYKIHPIYREMINEVCTNIKSATHFNATGLSDEVIFEKSGFTKNPTEFLAKEYDNVTIMIVCTFFKSELFKNTRAMCVKQHAMCSNYRSRFPLCSFIFEIGKLLTTSFFSKSNPYFETVFRYQIYIHHIAIALLKKAVHYWITSKANNEVLEDYLCIMNILKLDLHYLNLNLKGSTDITTIFEAMEKDLTYDKIREVQYKFLQNDQYLDMLEFNDLASFKNVMLECVKSFIISERLLELTKGTICYLDKPSRNSKKSRMVVMALAPNRNSLLYKLVPESDPKLIRDFTTFLSSDTRKVPLISVKKIRVFQTNNQPLIGVRGDKVGSLSPGINKIFISSKNIATKISLLGNNNGNEVFSFYTDNVRSATLWADGLNLLTDNFRFRHVTDETKTHMETLFDIKMRLQLLPLSSFFENELTSMYAKNTVSTGSKGVLNTMKSTLKTDKISHYFENDYNKEDSFTSQPSNFLQVSSIDFDGKNAQSNFQYKIDTKDSGDPVIEEEFDYTYDELVSLTHGFYYN